MYSQYIDFYMNNIGQLIFFSHLIKQMRKQIEIFSLIFLVQIFKIFWQFQWGQFPIQKQIINKTGIFHEKKLLNSDYKLIFAIQQFIIIESNRDLPMNLLQQKPSQASPSTAENKVKLNQLSKFIFDVLNEKREIQDGELMKMMVSEFGSVKEETLKRRKYDTVNILHNADIIVLQKSQNTFFYAMKHDVPNSIKDLEIIKAKATNIQNRIQQKQKLIKRMRTASGNYKRLIQVNQVRKTDKDTMIQLPIVAATQPFTQYLEEDSEQKQIIKLKFPAGTKIINNIFAHSEIYNF